MKRITKDAPLAGSVLFFARTVVAKGGCLAGPRGM